MSAVSDAAQALRNAVEPVQGVRPYKDPGATLDPPAVVVGPPRLTWEAYCDAPTEAKFIVYLIVPFNDRAIDRLYELIEPVAEAIDGLDEAVVVRATPSLFQSGGQDLPSLEIETDYAL